MKSTIVYSLLLIAGLAFSMGHGDTDNPAAGKEFAILLNAKVTVLGPDVSLGDVGSIVIKDHKTRIKLLKMKITKAPPPGESLEISLAQIKRRLKSAGLDEYVELIQGPSHIRVMTAQTEIDKAIVTEEFV
jgi:hypothetical protein